MVGIDISDQTIKIIQLSDGLSRRLLTHYIYTLPPKIIENGIILNQSALQTELHTALNACKLTKKNTTVTASIVERQSFLRVIDMPEMKDAEVSEAIRWEITQHIPFNIEGVYMDWQDLTESNHPRKPGHREIQVGAAQKKVIDPLYSVLVSLGLDVAAFELESQAIVRALISKAVHEKQEVLIVDFGSTSTNVIVYDAGACRFSTSLEKGVVNMLSSVTPGDAKLVLEHLHNIPSDLSARIAPLILGDLDNLIVDIRGVIDFYNGIDSGHQMKEIIISGGGSNLPGLEAAFMHYFKDIHIQRGNPWINILKGRKAKYPLLDAPEAARFVTAIGLALRSVVPL